MEWGKCEICGQEGPIKRTYFYYKIKCECCSNKNNYHFEIVRHCNNCPAPMPIHIHPYVKDMYGRVYRAFISNILPIEIRGDFII